MTNNRRSKDEIEVAEKREQEIDWGLRERESRGGVEKGVKSGEEERMKK